MSETTALRLPGPWLHVVVDMQRVFAESGDWYAAGLRDIIAPITQLATCSADATVFTRFVTPHHAHEARGTWRGYYEHWAGVRLDNMSVDKLDVVAELARFVTPATLHDKTTHSAFNSGGFSAWLGQSRYATLVLSGVETDICVLATAFDAIDLGLGVIVARDAVASSSPSAHAAVLEHVLPRCDQQVRVLDVADIIDAWAR